MKESKAKPGQIVAITGAGGGLGSIAVSTPISIQATHIPKLTNNASTQCQYAKAMGLQVIAIDHGTEKREMCLKELGASSFIDFMTPETGDLVSSVKAATPEGLGPHAVIVVAANEKPFAQAAQYVRPRGTVVCVGLPSGARASGDVFDMVTRMVTICGSYVGNRADTQEALGFFSRGVIKAPFKIMGLSQLNEVYTLMKEQKIAGRIVLDTSY